MIIDCQVTPYGLTPLTDEDYEAKKRLKMGDIVRCQIKRPRNLRFHKKFFALLSLTYDNIPHDVAELLGISSKEGMLDTIKLALDHYDTYEIGGKTLLRLRSIAFDKMDDTEFETFYVRTVDFILHHLLPGLDQKTLEEEIKHYFR